MSRVSAGILVYRRTDLGLEVLLAHPGGPYWQGREIGAWTIPKGEVEPNEEPRLAAEREFREETGHPVPAGTLTQLDSVKQKGGKKVHAWAVEGSFDTSKLQSAEFEMEWPPRSGRRQRFPEIERLEWFALDIARTHMVPGQADLLDQLLTRVS